MKKLPIGIQTFSKIRSENYYYIDKTSLITELSNLGTYYFLSRPRRFGKSLFLDTIREAFLGSKELFQGLYLENNWDWSKKHPVVRIDFGSGVLKEPILLEKVILEIIQEHAKRESISLSNETISGRFRELIIELEKKYSEKVVVLVDEYDKPILDNITNSEIAREMRDGLRNLYSVIKGADAYIKFVFITGVSKFSKVNLFSGLNNLKDITLDERYATICGYTEEDLAIFAERLEGVDRDKMKLWYNGYNFLGDSVYNPFDILLFLEQKKYKNYWFETGNPSFLTDLIQKNKYNSINLENIKISDAGLNSFDVDSIELESLLFQTGYLTIKEKKEILGESVYTLSYPNQEVKRSLTSAILHSLSHIGSGETTKRKLDLYEVLSANDISMLKTIFHSFFASIPHDWYRKNQLANYEGYYASIFYCYFTALGLDVRAEEPSNHGQVDMTVLFESKVYVFEFKVIEMTEQGSALTQIKEKRYYQKHLGMEHKEIYLIGVEFSKEERNITSYEWELLPSQ
ncbi:MAG: AAA family ATPase [Spirochaetota bacterium]